MQAIKQPIQNGFRRWIERRSPRADEVLLRHKTIYVLPTRQGVGFMVMLLLLWVLGTNYQNNLILGLVFLLIGLVFVSVVHAFRNLSGLRLKGLRGTPAFVGDLAEFELLISRAPSARHESISLGWEEGLFCELDLIDHSEARVTLSHRARRRGWLRPERLLIESHFPLGLIRAWSWAYLDVQTLVYPKPCSSKEIPLAHMTTDSGERLSRENQEEFQGFRAYQEGAPLTHVAWKLYARGAGMHLKEYMGFQSEQVWLDWHRLAGLDQESRLSQLCYWVLEFGKTTAEYGLRLPSVVVPLGRGADHQRRVLKELALYGIDSDERSGW
ncbi:DUF58 domain-containing protein [Marinimicrobium sp. ABcell2]|uniref:DUF58 domain-containing protein n=1 Tax=Marinimicrobium sp. ABcell2 TaxID=3069751 RepID=UPI0027ADE888|nr:DUF58 domain-containing protein [Marinimicrobium sp. ABcell2]MDQ2075546.1 DUF58 domain-containing protein [Marinimicrobium sp. ABcell2]